MFLYSCLHSSSKILLKAENTVQKLLVFFINRLHIIINKTVGNTNLELWEKKKQIEERHLCSQLINNMTQIIRQLHVGYV